MKTIETNTYILPAYWASVLINMDDSGTSKEDIAHINEFLATEKPGSCVGCSDESWFAHTNDFNNIGGDVLEYTFHK
jgi:hypothetical protein